MPLNHPLLLVRSEADLTLEWLEDRAEAREDLIASLGDRNSKINREAGFARLADLEVTLGLREPSTFSEDPVVDAWEKALEAGQKLEGFSDNVHPMIAARRGKPRAEPAKPLPIRR